MAEEQNTNQSGQADALKRQRQVGTYSISLSMDIATVTLRNNDVQFLYFIEDIFSYAMVGKIRFLDMYGITELGPLTGNEKVTVTYTAGDAETRTREFYVYKVSNITGTAPSSNGKIVVELHLVDGLFLLMNQREYSVSWSDKKIHEIIQDISKNMLMIDNMDTLEETKETMPCFVMPYWTPREAIDYLCKRASSAKNDKPGFIFYSSSENIEMPAYHFVSLDSLIEAKDLMKLGDDDDGTYVFDSKNMYEYNKIIDYKINGIDRMATRGIRGGQLLGFDPTQNKPIVQKYTYKDAVEKTAILGEVSLFPDFSTEDIRHRIEAESDPAIIDNIFHSEWKRRYLTQQAIIITCRGHSNRACGKLIEIKWPSVMDNNQMYNKNLSGKYLIKSITHLFSGDVPNYKQLMVLVKNGYTESNDKTLLRASSGSMNV